MTSMSYPNSGPTYSYTFDTMGRMNGMTDSNNNTLVNGITYGPAGELLTVSYLGYNETRQYNAMKQLTRLTTTGTSDHVDFQYFYSATQNNGKITEMTDWVTGEDVTYTYDSLERLASAVTTTNPNVPQWGQSYGYDGFGNLTDQTLTKGSGPDVHVLVNPATNRLTSDSYDANGNDLTFGSYDLSNRMAQAGAAKYGYAPDGKRVWKAPDGTASHEEFYFWTPAGQRLGTYKSTNPGVVGFTTASTNVYFGGRLIQAQGMTMVTDQLGSNVGNGKRYYPYGAEKPSATTNNIEKFAGYFRDTETGLDYADQRYHQPGMGRFTSSDPSTTSVRLSDPGSWNRYAYVGGDPVNRTDPSGLCSTDGYGDYYDDDYSGSTLIVSGPCALLGNPDALAIWGDGGGEGGGGGYNFGQTDEVTVSATVSPPPPTASVFQYDLGQGVDLTYSTDYDLVYGAPGFGSSDPSSQINTAYNLACQYATYACGSADQVGVTYTGGTYNVQLFGNPFDPNSAGGCSQDPAIFNSIFHSGSDASYYCGGNYFGDTPHVVNDPYGISAHYDDPGPLNPLHFISVIWGLIAGPGQQQFYTCSTTGVCDPN